MTLYPSRLVLILLAASALTACSTYKPFADQPSEPARPNFPIRAPAQTPDQGGAYQPPAQDSTPAPQASPLPPVESRPLDAPAAAPAYPAPSTYQPQAPAYQAPPPPVMQTVTKLTVTGKVVTVGGPPKTHKVKSGDNLDAIARDLGTTRKQLAEDNDLKAPFRIHPGDVLKGPSTEAKAYVVGSGDTLYAIARRFDVTGQALAEANDMSIDDPLSVGRKLTLPDGYKDKGPTRVETQVEVSAPAPRSTYPQPSYPSQTYPAAPRTQPAPETRPYSPPPEPPRPTTVVTTTTKLSVTGKVVEIEGPPAVHVVEKGDAVDAIARGFDMTRQEFVKLNKLKEPYNIHPGDRLKGPPRTLKAYVIGSGDTLALVAKRFNVTPKALAAANDMKTSAALRPGKKLTLPEGFKDKGPIKETVRSVTETPAPSTPYTPPPQPQPQLPSQPRPYTPSPTTPKPQPAPSSPAVIPPSASELSESQISTLGRGRFQWPLRGEIISDFGPKGTGQRNDGVNIRARAGDPVRSAASGDVVYAGDQVPGFGNLVLIKHADGWVTAYGHLARVDVKMQQKVAQGQQIGQAGSSGGVSEPQLHFEVRYAPSPNERAKPIDPQLVLPK